MILLSFLSVYAADPNDQLPLSMQQSMRQVPTIKVVQTMQYIQLIESLNTCKESIANTLRRFTEEDNENRYVSSLIQLLSGTEDVLNRLTVIKEKEYLDPELVWALNKFCSKLKQSFDEVQTPSKDLFPHSLLNIFLRGLLGEGQSFQEANPQGHMIGNSYHLF